MMDNKYVLIDESILPEYLKKVIQAQEYTRNGMTITESCQKAGVPRSTFYKYKDYIYQPNSKAVRRMVINLKLIDETGVLSNVLNFVAKNGGNVLSINQEMPIHNIAFVTLTIDAINLCEPINVFMGEVKELPKVVEAILTAVE